jgi:hypothetical protein
MHRLLAGFAQGVQKAQTILVIGKDGPTLVSPRHDVVNSARIFDSKGPSH